MWRLWKERRNIFKPYRFDPRYKLDVEITRKEEVILALKQQPKSLIPIDMFFSHYRAGTLYSMRRRDDGATNHLATSHYNGQDRSVSNFRSFRLLALFMFFQDTFIMTECTTQNYLQILISLSDRQWMRRVSDSTSSKVNNILQKKFSYDKRFFMLLFKNANAAHQLITSKSCSHQIIKAHILIAFQITLSSLRYFDTTWTAWRKINPNYIVAVFSFLYQTFLWNFSDT